MGSAFSRSSWEDYASMSNKRLLSTPQPEMTSYVNRVSAYLAEDPRSPANADATFERTPLEIRVEKKNTRVSSDGSFLMFSKTSTPNVVKPPSQSSLDPRSPTIGIERTPVVSPDGEDPKQSDSLEVMTNYTNLQISWDLDESNSNEASSQELFNKNLMSSTPKPVKAEETEDPVVEIHSLKVPPRTPLSKLPNSTGNSPSKLIISPAAEKKSGLKKRNPTPSRNYQKDALANRIRRNAEMIQHDKEN